MFRFARTRVTLAALVLGTALALPLSQSLGPHAAHAAASQQTGGVLAGTWLNFTPGAPFGDLQITYSTTGAIGTVGTIGAPVPSFITYAVNVFSLTRHRYVAFGVSAPVPFMAGDRAIVTLRALPIPTRFTTITLDLSLVSTSTLRVGISPYLGHHSSVEYMHR